jgi:hypothetical protein
MQWRQEPIMIFLPLYWVDTRFWHTYDAAHSGRYPITKVDRNEIWRYYEAWGLLEESPGEADPVSGTQDVPETSDRK